MPSDLKPHEREEKEVERLINKEPAPSRKPTDRRAPRHDERRERITVDDPDMTAADKDMSLNYKTSGYLLADVALNVLLAAEPKTKPKVPRPAPKTKPAPKAKPAPQPKAPKEPKKDPVSSLKSAIEGVTRKLQKIAPAVAKSFATYAGDHWLEPAEWDASEVRKGMAEVRKVQDSIADADKFSYKGIPGDHLPSVVAGQWPSKDLTDWATRAGIISGIRRAVDSLSIPASFKVPFLRGKGSVSDPKLIKAIVDDVGRGLDVSDIESGELMQFAYLAAVYRSIADNPASVTASGLASEVKTLSKDVHAKAEHLLDAMAFMHTWEGAMKEFAHHPGASGSYEPGLDYSGALKSLDAFMKPGKSVVDPQKLLGEWEDHLKDKYGDIPRSLQPAFLKAAALGAASNEGLGDKAMVQKTATYHGIVQQDHPSGPTNTGYRSYDKRYFGKEHYDAIVASAKEFLSSDWLKYSWDGGAPDAPYRAALDLAIWTADSSLYQSKIDAETYDMLLNRLAGWGHDQFAETVVPKTKSKRSASAMSQTYVSNILHVASALRQREPRMALDIVKNLRALLAADEHTGIQQQGQQQEQQAQQQEQQAQQQEQAGVEDKDMEAFVEGKIDLKDLGGKVDKLIQAKDIEDFLAGIKDIEDLVHKSAAGRSAAAPVDMTELAPLADMDDEEVKAFLADKKKLENELKSAISAGDIDKFMEGLDELFQESKDKAHQVKTSSVRVSLSTLVRIAHAFPGARAELLPIIAAARKKDKAKDKKKDKPKAKQSQQEQESQQQEQGQQEEQAKKKGKKAPPFGGKKAPPFGKKKGAPPFGGKKKGAPPFGGKKAPPFGKKKKASVEIANEDISW